jgi:cytochrome c
MKTLFKLAFLALLALQAAAAGATTLAEGKQLVDAAIAEIGAKGVEAAARDFTASGKWQVGSTYIVLNDLDGKLLAHASNPKMVGKVMLQATDASGKAFVQECIQNIKARGESLIELKWANPLTHKFADAQMYSKRVPGKDLYISVLVFK